jgi:hypothetical protein
MCHISGIFTVSKSPGKCQRTLRLAAGQPCGLSLRAAILFLAACDSIRIRVLTLGVCQRKHGANNNITLDHDQPPHHLSVLRDFPLHCELCRPFSTTPTTNTLFLFLYQCKQDRHSFFSQHYKDPLFSLKQTAVVKIQDQRKKELDDDNDNSREKLGGATPPEPIPAGR